MGMSASRLAVVVAAIAAWAPHCVGAQVEAKPTLESAAAQLRTGPRARRVRAAVWLGRSGNAAAVPHLRAALANARPGLARTILLSLGMHRGSQAAAEALAEQAESPDVTRRLLAVNGLGSIGHPAGIGPLTAALKDPDARVRACAASALGLLPGPQAVPGLEAAAGDVRRDVRLSAVMALGDRTDEASARVLEKLIASGPTEVREAAATALVGNKALLRHVDLKQLMQTAPAAIKRQLVPHIARQTHATPAVLAAVEKQARAQGDALSAAMAATRRDYLAVMKRLHEDAGDQLPKLEEALAKAKLIAVLRLAKNPTPAALCALAEMTKRPERDTKWKVAVVALSRIATPDAATILRMRLAESPERPSCNLMNAIGLVQDANAIPLLAAILHSDESGHRSVAAQTLGMVGSQEAVGPLMAHLDDADPSVRSSVELALSLLPGEPALAALRQRWTQSTDDATQASVVRVLSLTQTRQVVALLRKLRQDASPGLLPAIDRAIDGLCQSLCYENLQIISAALTRCVREHEGRLPRRLSDLAPKYLPDPQVLQCPGDPLVKLLQDDTKTSYMYPVDPKGHMGQATPIVCDVEPSNHADKGRNVLYLDGTVRRVAEEEFWEIMEALAAPPE